MDKLYILILVQPQKYQLDMGSIHFLVRLMMNPGDKGYMVRFLQKKFRQVNKLRRLHYRITRNQVRNLYIQCMNTVYSLPKFEHGPRHSWDRQHHNFEL